MNTVKIKGTEYIVKPTLRAMFIFEQITKKAFKIESMLDNYIYFYALILANNPKNIIDWDSFIDALDEDPTIYDQLSAIILKNSEVDDLLSQPTEDGENGEVKKN